MSLRRIKYPDSRLAKYYTPGINIAETTPQTITLTGILTGLVATDPVTPTGGGFYDDMYEEIAMGTDGDPTTVDDPHTLYINSKTEHKETTDI